MLRRYSFLIVCLLFCALTAKAESGEFEQLYKHFQQVAAFDYNSPREKVYVHMDNSAYFTDETLWLKAYVVRATNLAPTDLSRVLYAELLNADGDLMERKLLRIEKGEADGHFELKLPITEGFYELRVFTREMLNWGLETCWSRVFPIFNKDNRDKSLNPEELRPVAEIDLKPGHRRPFDFPMRKGVQLDFYPEGGNLVAGLSQRVAFRLTDERGNPIKKSCTLLSAGGDTISTFSPLHEGMGSFTLPFVEEGYTVMVEGFEKKKFPLPAIQQSGFALSAKSNHEGADIVVQRTADAPNNLLGLIITCRGALCYFDTLHVDEGGVELFIPNESMHTGINKIELFNTEGKSLASRLVYKEGNTASVDIEIRHNAAEHDAFQPIALELYSRDAADGKPLPAHASISIRDAESDLTATDEAPMDVDLLLSSELKGYIAHPAFYFRPSTPDMALDLLLMVQGWSANSLEEMAGVKPFETPHHIEDKITLMGRVLKDNEREKIRPGATLSLSMISTKHGASLSSEAVTDSLGRFAFTSEVDFMGDWLGQFTVRTGEKEKRRHSRVSLNRLYDLPVRAFDIREMMPGDPSTSLRSAQDDKNGKDFAQDDKDGKDSAQDEEHSAQDGKKQSTALSKGLKLFEWEDTIPRGISINLGEAIVTGKNKYHGLRGNRHSYKGGEKAGMQKATYYYNVLAEAERIKDAGGSTPTIWEWIREVNDKFDFEIDAPPFNPNSTEQARDDIYHNFTYLGKPCMIFIDNTLLDPYTMFMEEVRSVVIMDRREKWHKFIPAGYTKDLSNYDAAVFVYTNPDFKYFLTKKGVDKRHIQGFADPKNFYSPNYRYIDAANPEDFRRTLYWNPSLTFDEKGKAGIVLFNNAIDGVKLRISLRGRSEDGRFISVEQ